jgi:hypothetical protein
MQAATGDLDAHDSLSKVLNYAHAAVRGGRLRLDPRNAANGR